MRPRQPPLPPHGTKPCAARIPQHWLMLDARLEEAGAGEAGLRAALRGLPPRSAVVVRPAAMTAAQRAAWRRLHFAARARGHRIVAGAGAKGRDRHLSRAELRRAPKRRSGFVSAAVHDAQELARAGRHGAQALIISRVFATRSHAGAGTLGRRGLQRLAAQSRPAKVIALGGVDAERFRRLRSATIVGWAAIDAWLPRQPKRHSRA